MTLSKEKLSIIVGIGLAVLVYAQTSLAENPCEQDQHCRELSVEQAMALSWEKGIREYSLKSDHEVRFEAKYNCPTCRSYSKDLFGSGGSCYKRDNTSENKKNNRPDGFTLKNASKMNATLEVKLRETYSLVRNGRGSIEMKMIKDVVNGQAPIGLSYTFNLKERSRNCYITKEGPFASTELIYDSKPFALGKSVKKVLKIDGRKSFDLGSSANGFRAPVNTVAEETRKTGGPWFGYRNNKYTTLKATKGIFSQVSDFFRNGSTQIYDQKVVVSQFKKEIPAFMSVKTAPSRPQFWITGNASEVLFVRGSKPRHSAR